MRCLALIGSFLLVTVTMAQDEEFLREKLHEHKDEIVSLAFSPDGKTLVSGGMDKQLIVWQLSNEEVQYESYENFFPPKSIVVTRQNNIFYGSGTDIVLVNKKNEAQAVFKGNSTHVWTVAYATERNKIAAGAYDYNVEMWNVSDQEMQLKLEGHDKSVLAVAFSPDEKYLVTGSLDKTIKIWNANTGDLIKTLNGHTDNIFEIEFHPSGKYFASASRDRTIRLWDIKTGEILKSYIGHGKSVYDIEFTNDGLHLFSASLDGTIRLWETMTGKSIYSFVAHEGTVLTIDISPNNELLASAGQDGKIYLWELREKIYILNKFGDDITKEKSEFDLFDERRKGEKRHEYEERRQEAEKKEKEIVLKYYKMYIDELSGILP